MTALNKKKSKKKSLNNCSLQNRLTSIPVTNPTSNTVGTMLKTSALRTKLIPLKKTKFFTSNAFIKKPVEYEYNLLKTNSQNGPESLRHLIQFHTGLIQTDLV